MHPYRLHAPFVHLPLVRQYQIVHDGAGLHVRLVLDSSAPPETAAQVRAALVRELEEAGVAAPPVEVVSVSAIEREPGHAAKVKLVKSIGR